MTDCAQLIEEELAELNQIIEDNPVERKDVRKAKCRKLRKVLRKVKDDFSVRSEKYETYRETFQRTKQLFQN